MPRVAEILKIRPGEGRRAGLLVILMLVTSAGGSLGGNGIEALFLARGGVALLPVLISVLGGAMFLLNNRRMPAARAYAPMLLGLAALLCAARALAAVNLPWANAVLWLSLHVVIALQASAAWGLAAAACDAGQAARLFPLLGLAALVGTMLGGFATTLLVPLVHAENLLLAWAVALVVAFGIARALPGRNSGRGENRGSLRAGYDYVRGMPFMAWLSGIAALWSLLFFLLYFPFADAVAGVFTDADTLAGFLGMFQGFSAAAACLAALFIANDLFARFGRLNALLICAGLYLFGFAALTAQAVAGAGNAFGIIVLFRALETMWFLGAGATAFQALFSSVPPERRAQVRAFVAAVPGQAGTVLAGLILLGAAQWLRPQQLFALALLAAAACVLVVWRARRAYRRALVAALHAGQPEPFFLVEEPFGGFRYDAVAVDVAVNRAVRGDPAVRRVAVEILGHIAAPAAAGVLVDALRDDDAGVRSAALLGLARAGACQAVLEVAVCLRDPEPAVRLQAIETLQTLAPYPRGIAAQLAPWLADSDPAIRASIAVALLRVGEHPEAHDGLRAMLGDPDHAVRASGLEALGACGDEDDFNLVAGALQDPHPTVRQAAASVILPVGGARATEALVRVLRDDAPGVRAAAAQALGKIGGPALQPVLAALADPAREAGALAALAHLPLERAAATLRAYAQSRTAKALYYHELAARTAGNSDAMRLLSDSLQERASRHGFNALRAVGLLGHRAVIELAIDGLASNAPGPRATALEIIETAGEPEITRPLLWLWDPRNAPRPGAADRAALHGALAKILADGDPWLRACAAQVAGTALNPELQAALGALAERDRDSLVRATAAAVLRTQVGGLTMRTLTTQSPMERILLLRRVPLFAGLEPGDLKPLAAVAEERLYQHGDALANQGDLGDELFVIVSGEVRVVARQGNGTLAEIARSKAGDVLGETAVVNPEPRPVSYLANGEVRVLCLGQKPLEGILRDKPDMALAVLRQLATRVRARA